MDDSSALLRLLLIGFWFPLFAAGAMYLSYRFFYDQKLRMLQYRYERPARDREAEIELRMERTQLALDELLSRNKEINSFMERYLEAGLERIDHRLNTTVREMQGSTRADFVGFLDRISSEMARTRAEINQLAKSSSVPGLSPSVLRQAIHESLQVALQPELSSLLDRFGTEMAQTRGELVQVAKKPTGPQARDNVVREISHALFTPLSRIAAISSNVLSYDISPEIEVKMKRAKSAVEICYSYLSAYRELVNIAGATTYWNPDSLKEALEASAQVYVEQNDLSIDIQVRSPEQIPGLSNFYVLACLLPLTENAVEASRDGDAVKIEIGHDAAQAVGRVTNQLHEPFPGSDVFQPNFTTKSSNSLADRKRKHEGLGITIVLNLLSNLAGASLDYDLANDNVTFVLRLPATGG